jgi:uncharacterized surface protein with fasciclin (FAS1) repeats
MKFLRKWAIHGYRRCNSGNLGSRFVHFCEFETNTLLKREHFYWLACLFAILFKKIKSFMKKTILKVAAVFMLSSMLFIRCGTSSMLSAASPLISALSGAGNLGSMASLLQTPGLGKVLGGALKGPFTLLAPTDNALASLGSGVLSNLTKPENIGQLGNILSKHIVPGKLDAGALAKGGLNTAAGTPLNLGGVNLGNLLSGGKNTNIIPVDKVLQ